MKYILYNDFFYFFRRFSFLLLFLVALTVGCSFAFSFQHFQPFTERYLRFLGYGDGPFLFFWMAIHLYFSIFLITKDRKEHPSFLFLRMSLKKWIRIKLLSCFLFQLLLKVFLVGLFLLFSFFFSSFDIPWQFCFQFLFFDILFQEFIPLAMLFFYFLFSKCFPAFLMSVLLLFSTGFWMKSEFLEKYSFFFGVGILLLFFFIPLIFCQNYLSIVENGES